MPGLYHTDIREKKIILFRLKFEKQYSSDSVISEHFHLQHPP